MDPKAHELLAGCGFRLRNLVLVMRKLQIDSAGMDVERLAQILHCHGGALQVPARPSRPERPRPMRLVFAAGFPQREIAGIVFLVFVLVDAGAGSDAFRVEPRELPVVVPARNLEIRRAAAAIGVPLFGNALDKAQHRVDVFGRARDLFGLLQPQPGGILEKRLLVFSCVIGQRKPLLAGVLDDLVVHVGDVHHMQQFPAATAQIPAQNVLKGKRPQIPDVGVVIDGRTAGVHFYGLAVRRLERLVAAGQAVVKLEGHGFAIYSSLSAIRRREARRARLSRQLIAAVVVGVVRVSFHPPPGNRVAGERPCRASATSPRSSPARRKPFSSLCASSRPSIA